MELLDLPPEILKTVLEHFVNALGLLNAPRLRLVCKLFDQEIIDALFATRIIDRTPHGAITIINSSLGTRYLQRRILSKGRNTNHFRRTVDLTVDLLLESAKIPKSQQSRHELTTALHTLALERPYHLLELLDDSSRSDSYQGEDTADSDAEPNHHTHYDYKHLLAAAVYTSDASLVKTLLQDGVDVHKSSEYFETPFCIAASRGFNSILILLLEHDADTNGEKAKARLSSECLAVNAIGPSIALQSASLAGHEHTVRLLLEPKYNIDTHGDKYANAAVQAARGGHSNILRLLIKASHGQLKDRGLLQQTMVIDASEFGHDGVIRMLLDYGTSPDCTNYQGRTPLEIAAMKGHANVAELLLKRGANPHEGYVYPLIQASKYGYKRIAEMLLDYGANIDKQIYPAPVAAAAMHGQAHMVSFLVERDANLKLPSTGNLAIYLAAGGGWESVVSMLVDYGVSMDGSKDDLSPMESAARAGHDHVVKRLTELRAKTTS